MPDNKSYYNDNAKGPNNWSPAMSRTIAEVIMSLCFVPEVTPVCGIVARLKELLLPVRQRAALDWLKRNELAMYHKVIKMFDAESINVRQVGTQL